MEFLKNYVDLQGITQELLRFSKDSLGYPVIQALLATGVRVSTKPAVGSPSARTQRREKHRACVARSGSQVQG